jgi:hypothetical protein
MKDSPSYVEIVTRTFVQSGEVHAVIIQRQLIRGSPEGREVNSTGWVTSEIVRDVAVLATITKNIS